MSLCPVLLSSCPPRPRCALRGCVRNFKESRFPLATGRGIGYTFSDRQRKANEMGKLIVTFLVAAMTMGVMAETVNTVTVTKFNQSYPSTGISGFGRALTVSSDNFIRSILSRSAGRSVRPVRDAD